MEVTVDKNGNKWYGDFSISEDGSIFEWGSSIHYNGHSAYRCSGKKDTWSYERWAPNFGNDAYNDRLAREAWEQKAHEAWVALGMGE